MFKAERLLESLLDTFGIGVCIVDHRNKIVEVNDIYCQIYEYRKAALIGQPFTILQPESYRDRAQLSYQEFVSGHQQKLLKRIQTRSGANKTVQISVARTEDGPGQPRKIYYIQEIQQSHPEPQPANSPGHFGESLKTALLRVTTTGIIRFANPYAYSLLCQPAGTEHLNNKLTYYQNDSSQKLGLVEFLNEQGFLDNQEVLLDRPEHAPLWAQISATTVMHQGDEVCFDISLMSLEPHKLKERKLKNTVSSLKSANKQLDHFVYGATHDLKAPLASLSGLLHILRKEPDPDQKEVFMQMMEKSIHRLNEFIREIVDYSRNANQELKSEEVYFEPLVLEIFESLEYMENASKINASVDIEQTVVFRTDKLRLRVILNNLISNAYKYSSAHRRDEAFIRVSVKADELQATIRIEDNGQGIDQAHIEKIFDMFFRATEGQGGSGLGLYLVKETLDKMNGTIHVVSEVGKGSCFVVNIPSADFKVSKTQLDLGI